MSANPFADDYVEPAAPEPKPAPEKRGRKGIVYHRDVQQGTVEWLECRRGLLTASEMKLILTPTLKLASNDKEKTHLYELLAQRVTGYVEPTFQSYDMERGNFDEEHARAKYSEEYAEVEECGFITNDKLGFDIGYSPDGLVGDDGLIEAKSRVQKYQMRNFVEYMAEKKADPDFIIQLQSALYVSERQWIDFISYSGGMLMGAVRVYPMPEFQAAIEMAALDFERRLTEKREIYEKLIASDARLVPTERLLYL